MNLSDRMTSWQVTEPSDERRDTLAEYGLSVQCVEGGGAAILVAAGSVDASTVAKFDYAVGEVIAKRLPLVVVDLTKVGYLSAAGIGSLVKLRREAAAEGGAVILAGPQSHIAEMLEVTAMDQLFETAESVDAAVDLYFESHVAGQC